MTRVFQLCEHTLLTAEEERKLGQAIERGRHVLRVLREWLPEASEAEIKAMTLTELRARLKGNPQRLSLAEAAYDVMQGAQQARDRLMQHNYRLVARLARHFQCEGLPYEDLFQEGCIGLMTAIERFDWSRSLRFSTYATWWIRQSIYRAVVSKSKLVRLPAYLHQRLQRLRAATLALTKKLGAEPEVSAITQTLQMSERAVRKLQALNAQTYISIDGQIDDSDERSPKVEERLRLPSHTSHEILDICERREWGRVIYDYIAALPKEDQALLTAYLGLLGEREPIRVITKQLGMPRHTVNQKLKRHLLTLRQRLSHYVLPMSRRYVLGRIHVRKQSAEP